MKGKRFISLFLVLCLISCIPSNTIHAQNIAPVQETAQNSAKQPKGDLEFTILLNYEAKPDELRLSLQSDTEVLFDGIRLKDLDEGTVTLADQKGQEIGFSEPCAIAKIAIRQIPVGKYKATLFGNGYKTYTTEVVLDSFSKNIVVANNNTSFTAGDLNKDGQVNDTDLTILKEHLSTNDAAYDLNGDQKVDLTDYAYLLNNIYTDGSDFILNTTLIPEVAFSQELITPQQAAPLFSGEEVEAIGIKSHNGGKITQENPAKIEVPFESTILPELQYVMLSLPIGNVQAPAEGIIEYADEDGKIHEVPFSNTSSLPMIKSLDTMPTNTIKVDLGKRVAVKKITIKITKTQGDTSLASIGKVTFLQELTATVQDEVNRVNHVTAVPGNKSVSLTWSALQNVSEYLVKYGTAPGVYTTSLPVMNNQVKIEGLENDTKYYFIVSGINGSWEGIPSYEVSAAPFEDSAPGKVGGLAVESGDQQLSVTWSSMKNTEYYNLYYKEHNSNNSYVKVSQITSTGYTIKGLKNKTSYIIAVSACNKFGEGGKSSEALGIPDEITIAEPKGIPTYNQLDNSNIESIRLSHPDHYDKGIYPNGFDPKTVIDGDYKTHWTARGNWWENQGFVVKFNKAYDMDHMVWVTRLDQNLYKTANDRYYVEVWGESDDLTKSGTILANVGSKIKKNPLSKDGVEILTFPKTSVKQIRISVKIWDGARVLPSAAELHFYEYYSIVDEITALFKDDLHSKLASGVTAADIQKLKDRVNGNTGEFYVEKSLLLQELMLAENLLAGTDMDIISVEKGRNASKDTTRNFAFSLNELQPLGVVQSAEESLIVYVESSGTTLPELVATQYAGEASAWSETISLQKGRNIITPKKIGASATQRGGSLYISYHGTDEIKLNIVGGIKIPILNLPDFSFEEITVSNEIISDPKMEDHKKVIKTYIENALAYEKTIKIPAYNTIQSAIANSTEVATKHVLLSIPLKSVTAMLSSYKTIQDKTDALYHTIVIWEENMKLHYSICGLSEDAPDTKDQFPSSRINIRYMTMTGKAFMYAGGAHIGIDYPSSAGMIQTSLPSESAKNGFFGWGINHEIGHVLDQNGLVEGETTNNIHSLYSQTFDYNKNIGVSRLEGEIYDSVYDKTALGMPGKSNNVFVQLAMYWQLHLMYDDVDKNTNFYSELYKLNRSKTVSAASQEMLFVKLASDIAKKDLTQFFTRWGYELDSDTKTYISKYQEETNPIYYLNDTARRYRLNSEADVFSNTETLLVTAKQRKTEDVFHTSVQLQITLPDSVTNDNRSAILGYEITRNNKVIAYIPAKAADSNVIEYQDNNLVLNNVILNYKITAYDMNFNKITGDALPFQIQYDGAMDNSNFIYDTDDSLKGLTIDLQKEEDISGIRIASGAAFTVPSSINGTVYKDGNEVPVILSLAQEQDGSAIYYFNYPEIGNTDGRIWTYGVDKLWLDLDTSDTSIAWKSILTTIKYPGDMIEFNNSDTTNEINAIGKLKTDYRYGQGTDDVIKAGSLIVVGNYRGDPMYNAIKMYGTYSLLPGEGDDFAPNEKKENQLLEGDQFLFAEVPENKVMTNISNGLWIYVLNVQDGDPLPDTIRAELYRVDNPDTLENERMVSNTMELSVPTWDSIPDIELTQE